MQVSSGRGGRLVRAMRPDTQVNWIDPTHQSFVDQNGKHWHLQPTSSSPAGTSAMTADQLMSLDILQEPGHGLGKSGSGAYYREIWSDCFK
jgi:hypothetical protein